MTADQKEMAEIADKLSELCRGYTTRNIIAVLSTMLPLLWCSGRRFTTVTEALDLWRDALSPDMEHTIRKAFGDIRYGDPPISQRNP